MSSNNAVKQQDYRERKKEKMIVDLMKSQTIGRAKATRIIQRKYESKIESKDNETDFKIKVL